ncbi:ferric uptake regulator [[Clostridium] sordellii]|uniref:Ferric uptake regulator n=1 Tax=Paraclostridium sordellii TaxID=1505 RepID=A0A9P1KZJ1_PARSO|nr:transcriptional repressor [Paeniclostridium sordellii]MBX9179600.1 transcriptional repressor [Paeniclostridium sordellii]MCQ4696846.1 transcriptional repressor [Paeniclostridium sordellii]MDU2148052.1 transcriptional repressor [Paeniclostridium sordellii]MDU2687441.1 transcriptional repressor [Paeniclostridium sordellii]MDU4413186.1 transcriptional repressor [Paeniclostridium sordellii]
MNETIEYIKKLFKKKGYKFTIQKKTILEVLLENKEHKNAKQIHDKVKNQNIGITTVYRTLNLFTELDIVKEINISGTSYYEIKIFSKNPFHIHFKCFKCNSIIDINNKDINLNCLDLKQKVESVSNLDIYDINIMFTGLCKSCKEEFLWQDQQKLEQ